LFVNESTLPVLFPLAPATTVLDRLPAAVATVLEAHAGCRTVWTTSSGLSLRPAETPCGPLYGRHGSVDRELAVLVAQHRG